MFAEGVEGARASKEREMLDKEARSCGQRGRDRDLDGPCGHQISIPGIEDVQDHYRSSAMVPEETR